MAGKFTVQAVQPQYTPLPWTEPPSAVEPFLQASSEVRSTNDFLYLSADTWITISEHIGWGNNTPHNTVEQGGILLGRVYEHPDGNQLYGMVVRAIPAYTQGSPAYVRFDHAAWKSMIDEYDRLTSQEELADLQIIGWFHTHPGSLPVFMSGTDLNTQRSMFSQDWQFAIVLNPHKRIWRAFKGAQARECKGEVIKQTIYAATS